MFKHLLNTKFHLRFTLNPIIRYKADNMGDMSGINMLKREVPIIVSLTSYDDRFDDLEIALYSLLNQSIKPDRIILWLSDEYEDLSNIPYSISKFIKNGLEIRFVKDLRSYTKIYYALKQFSNSIIVTADDDIFYPKDWLEKLYYSYITFPSDIHVHRAHRVIYENNKIYPYEKWQKHVKEENARFDNFLTGVGGVIYPPNCFSKEVFRKDVFLNYSPFADDIWLWMMALISNRKIRVVKNHIPTLTCTDFLGQIGILRKRSLYSINKLGENDKQLKELMKFYGTNVLSKLNK